MVRLFTGASAPHRGIVFVAVITGLVIGVLCGTLVSAHYSDSGAALAAELTPAQWPQNPGGLTYGSALNATCPEEEPDLIQAVATNGRSGYVLRTNLEEAAGANLETPETALNEQARRAGQSVAIPVYDLDGITVIGVFEVNPGQAVTTGIPSE